MQSDLCKPLCVVGFCDRMSSWPVCLAAGPPCGGLRACTSSAWTGVLESGFGAYSDTRIALCMRLAGVEVHPAAAAAAAAAAAWSMLAAM